jgi:hypothetical protein
MTKQNDFPIAIFTDYSRNHGADQQIVISASICAK